MGSFRLAAGRGHLHPQCNFAESLVETVRMLLCHSCRSELTRQGISLFSVTTSFPKRAGHFCRPPRVATRFGLYHPRVLAFARSGMQSLRILKPAEDLLIGVPPLSAIVHVAPDIENSLDARATQVLTISNQRRECDELCEVPLLLRRQKSES